MRKVIFLKWIVSNIKNWIFMRLIWILFSLKRSQILSQICFTRSLPLNLRQEMNLCSFRVQQTICLKGFKSGGSLVGNECKTRNHYASHNNSSLGQQLSLLTLSACGGWILLGVSLSRDVLFGLLIDLSCQYLTKLI